MPGEMRCGGMAVTQGSVSMCVWLDSDTFGIVVILGGGSVTTVEVEVWYDVTGKKAVKQEELVGMLRIS